MTNTYPVQMTEKQIYDLKKFIDWFYKQIPFMPENISLLHKDLEEILRYACFKHKILCDSFQHNNSSYEIVCPKCNPKRYNEVKHLRCSR